MVLIALDFLATLKSDFAFTILKLAVIGSKRIKLMPTSNALSCYKEDSF